MVQLWRYENIALVTSWCVCSAVVLAVKDLAVQARAGRSMGRRAFLPERACQKRQWGNRAGVRGGRERREEQKERGRMPRRRNRNDAADVVTS